MTTDTTNYTARVRNVELFEREKNNTTSLKVFLNGVQVVPTNATYTLRKPDGTGIVENGTSTIDGNGTCNFTNTAAQLSKSIPLGEGYMQEWVCTIDGKEYTFRRSAAVCKRRLYPTVTDADLEAEYSDLASIRASNLTSYQNYIDAAWYEILRRIRNNGKGYEYLILSPESFHDALMHLTLYKIWRDMHSSLGQSNGRYFDLANEHYRLYQAEYDQINFLYDEDHELKAGDPDNRTKGQPTIFLTQHGPYRFFRRP